MRLVVSALSGGHTLRVDKCNAGQIVPMSNSASFSAVFGAGNNDVPSLGAPWSPGLLAIMPPGAQPSPPAGAPPSGASSTPAGYSSPAGPGLGKLTSSEVGCKSNEVQRCDSKGQSHRDASKNTHIQILSGPIVDLRALSAVYGSGLCPGMLASPLHRAYSTKHCDCAGLPKHGKYGSCHKQPRNGFGPRHQKTWESVLSWKKKSKSSTKNKKKK
jgi:hypothetical protein